MDPVLTTLFVVMILGLAATMHVGVALGFAAITAIWVADLPLVLFTQKLYGTFDSFPLMAMPFFICVGDIMQRGTMAPALLQLSRTLVGHITGGLAQVSVLSCLFYGCLCGSPPATTASIGGIMIPAMEKGGYPKDFSTAVNSASGCLGALIPPSTLLIVYGATAGVSISDLFIAIIVPGILTGVLFMLMCMFISKARNYGRKEERAPFGDVLKALWDAKWAMMVPVLILGGIYSGITTPTEAGVVGVVYALFAESCITRAMTWKKVYEVFIATARTTGMLFFIITAANGVGIVMVYFNADTAVAALLQSITSNPLALKALVVLLIIVLGTFMEPTTIVLIMTPILLPLMVQCGVSPIHFGIIMGYGAILGNATPPVGMNLYVGCGISGISFSELSRAVMPFVWALISVYYLVAFVPWLSTCLL